MVFRQNVQANDSKCIIALSSKYEDINAYLIADKIVCVKLAPVDGVELIIMKHVSRSASMISSVVLATALLTACGGPSTNHPASQGQNDTASVSSQNAATANNAGVATASQANSRTNTLPTQWPKVGAWPTVVVRKLGHLPQALLGNALAIGPTGVPVSVGGYTGVASLTNVYQLQSTVKNIATLSVRTHDAAVGFLGNHLMVFGGGQATSYDTIVEIDGGKAAVVGHLARPLSDATSVPLTVDGHQGLALVGGYDGSVYRTTAAFIYLSSEGQRVWSTLFTLPVQARYMAVASAGSALYMAGGQEPNGVSNGVYVWSPGKSVRRMATLPHGLEKAALFVAGPYLLVVGGEGASGVPTNLVVGVDTRNGAVKTLGVLPTPLADMGYVGSTTRGILAGGVTSSSDRSVTNQIFRLTWQSK